MRDFKARKEKTPNCLFIYGEPGLGKTSLAKVLLEEYDYDVCEFNAANYVINAKYVKVSSRNKWKYECIVIYGIKETKHGSYYG